MIGQLWKMMGVVTLAALLAASCSSSDSGGGGTGKTTATVTGRVLDSNGDPVNGAVVMDQNTLVTAQTDSLGNFTIEIIVGANRLVVTQGKTLILEQCLATAEQVTYALGDLDPDTPTNCDVICTNGSGSEDRDCDGVLNDVELAGWDVTITLGDGKTETRHVYADPDRPDSDNDGLTDGEEYAARTDPGRKDTDGDLLSDYAEVVAYKSNPLNVDSDGDSRGSKGDQPSDPNLWDGYELVYAGTSPTLSDTDGDGLTDYEEVHSGGTDPLVANLPTLALDLYGDPHIEVALTSQSLCSDYTLDLAREEKERVKTDNESTKMSIENTVKIHTETKAGTSTWPPSFNAKITTDTEFKHGYMHESSNNFKETSVQEAQTKSECAETNGVDYANGKISVAMKLSNRSDLSFKVKELRIIAYQITTGSNFRLIGTLEPDVWPAGGYVLGPSGELTMTVKKTDIGADVMKVLVRNPSALMFEVGGYSLFQLDEWGVNETVNYAKLGESVMQRTGLIVIDYGDGTVERYMVATNVSRNPDGSGSGVTLKDALTRIIGLTYETEAQKDEAGSVIGRKVLKKVKTVETYQNDPSREGRGFWMVSGTDDAFAKGIDVDFNNIVLKNGQRINLTFLKDTDLDGIYDNEEYLLGTDKTSQDTDGDGLSDYDEAKVGWTVAVRNISYTVYPDPRFADMDGDYLTDALEFALGTDPFVADTDGDGVKDTNDTYPLSPPCLSGKLFGLAAWWNGATVGTAPTVTALDRWNGTAYVSTGDPNGYASNGSLTGTVSSITWKPPYSTEAGLNAVFGFNTTTGPTQKDQSIIVADDAVLDPSRSISPQAFTLSAWVYRELNATGAAWATVLMKGQPDTATYSLLLGTDGTVKLTIYRNAHVKCYGWFFGWIDGLCADWDANRKDELLGPKVPLQKWTHITATFSKAEEKMRIYTVDIDGVKSSSEVSTILDLSGPDYAYTNYLVANSEPLRIGLDAAPASAQWPFRGMLDDVQVFGRQMTPNEVTLYNDIGICWPTP